MTLKTERRTQHRKRPLSLVYVELPPGNGGMMRDLSEQGFSLRAMMPVNLSEKIPFSFVLDSSARIEGDAIVLRVEDGGRVAALEFAGLPAHCRDQIRRWLDKFDEPISVDSEPPQRPVSPNASLTELRTQIRAPKAPSQPERIQAYPRPTAGPTPPPPQTAEPEVAPQLTREAPAPLPPPMVAAGPIAEEPPPIAETLPSSAPGMMVLPKVAPPTQQQEVSRPPSPLQSPPERPEGPPLPPLLKLTSVRPVPPPAEIEEESAAPVEESSAAEPVPAAEVPVPKPERPPVAVEKTVIAPFPARQVVHTRMAPALEPISSFEGETDSGAPGWIDRFTLGRAVGIMLFLTLIASSYVYHRELGQALIWLGHQIAGDESPETSKSVQSAVPSASHQAPEPSPRVRAAEEPAPVIQRSAETTSSTSANLPAASDKTPSPQSKGGSPGSLVPLNQTTRTPSPAGSGDHSSEPGQPEYLQALQILRSPGRSSETPAAVQLLWTAVEKGNTGAEIDLAELFRTGRGVARNCDQARVLLSTAARKGSGEARKRLEALQRQGCG